MKVQPATYLLESTAREGSGEASTEAHMARANEHRKSRIRIVETLPTVEDNMRSLAMVRAVAGPRCPRTHGHMYICWDLGGLHSGPCLHGSAQGRRKTSKPAMYAMEKSDGAIVAMNAANNGKPAERRERRAPPEGKPERLHTHQAQDWARVSQRTDRTLVCRHALARNPREEPDALACTSGSVRGPGVTRVPTALKPERGRTP